MKTVPLYQQGLAVCLVALLLPLSTAGCFPLTYSAEAIEAWVVDKDTNQPLGGVVVVAHWQLEGLVHGAEVGELMVMETVTDAKGGFAFPAWGPKLRPLMGHLSYKDPELLLFQSGYEYVAAPNHWDAPETNSLRRSRWNGKRLTMKKFTGSVEEYARHLEFLDDVLRFAFKYDDCSWKKIPRMLMAMHRENQWFIEQGLRPSSNYPSSIETREGDNTPAFKKCGSVQEFLRSYLP